MYQGIRQRITGKNSDAHMRKKKNTTHEAINIQNGTMRSDDKRVKMYLYIVYVTVSNIFW